MIQRRTRGPDIDHFIYRVGLWVMVDVAVDWMLPAVKKCIQHAHARACMNVPAGVGGQAAGFGGQTRAEAEEAAHCLRTTVLWHIDIEL